ncbi:MAG: thioredoxin [Eudoraea sp.]|nr:thioredoxin [Eudoraea sp.]MBT8209533.1 thioredoxin [Eudoraea sp.]MBT8322774.1 thioredoxin [Eudoraea sp.]NNJ40430.1 thioredoxin [Eudoraea sp.]
MKSSFKKLVASDKPVLVDFHAEWCGPCKMLAPILKEVKEQMGENIKILKIDVDKNQPIAARYQIRGVPTMLLFRNGEIVWRQSGVVPKEQILKAIEAA